MQSIFMKIENIRINKRFFKLYIDKNDQVFDIKECQVNTWKEIQKGRKKISIPDEVTETRVNELFNHIYGNPYKIARNKVIAHFETF